jgi:uncharacterized protein YjbI with pentapeptide repeats
MPATNAVTDSPNTAADSGNPAADEDKRTPQDYAKLVEVLLPTVNGAAQRVQALWFSFVSFGAYLTIAVLGTTHRMLFLEEPVRMPLLNIDLSLTSFYTFAPGLLIVFHFYFMIQLVLLARTSSEFEMALARARLGVAETATLRMRLDNSIFVQLLVGADPERRGNNYWFIAPMAWLTTIILPIALLLLFQFQFLPYHAAWVTYLHRCAVTLDLALLLALWPTYTRGRGLVSWALYRPMHDRKSMRRATLRAGLIAAPAFAILVVAWSVAVFPTEGLYRNFVTRLPGILASATGGDSLPARWILSARDPRFVGSRPVSTFSFTEMLFEPSTNYVSGAPSGLFANSIILPDRPFVEDKAVRDLDQAEQDVAPGRHRMIRSFRGRDLAGAILPRTDLRRSDFTGADLRGATLVGASLQKSHFGCATEGNGDPVMASPTEIDRSTCARLTGARLLGARLDDSYLNGAVLEQADFLGARLVGATFWHYGRGSHAKDVRAVATKANFKDAGLQGVSLEYMRLDGASFDGADLKGASLNGASLVGASFFLADLVGTDFSFSDLRAASMGQATPIAASFLQAKMQGTMFENSSFHGAKFSGANLAGAAIIGGSAWRIRGAPMRTSSASIGLDLDPPPFGNEPFADWRKGRLNDVQDAQARAVVDKALAVLDPAAKFEDKGEFAGWLKKRAEPPDDEATQSEQTQEFIGLACDPERGPQIAYNLIHSSAHRAMGAGFAVFAEKIKRANDPTSREGARACPGAVGLDKDGLQRLDEILERDPSKPE